MAIGIVHHHAFNRGRGSRIFTPRKARDVRDFHTRRVFYDRSDRGDDTVNTTDALFALRAAVELEECSLCVCNVNGDGAVTATDTLMMLLQVVGFGEHDHGDPPRDPVSERNLSECDRDGRDLHGSRPSRFRRRLKAVDSGKSEVVASPCQRMSAVW